jgi:L-fuculose-phosphate aldolase
VMVIRGIGTYVYDRDINNLVKRVAILENSCRLLSIKSSY